jgi:hypothetical protein
VAQVAEGLQQAQGSEFKPSYFKKKQFFFVIHVSDDSYPPHLPVWLMLCE